MWAQKRLKQILDMEKYKNMIGSSKKIMWGRQDKKISLKFNSSLKGNPMMVRRWNNDNNNNFKITVLLINHSL